MIPARLHLHVIPHDLAEDFWVSTPWGRKFLSISELLQAQQQIAQISVESSIAPEALQD